MSLVSTTEGLERSVPVERKGTAIEAESGPSLHAPLGKRDERRDDLLWTGDPEEPQLNESLSSQRKGESERNASQSSENLVRFSPL